MTRVQELLIMNLKKARNRLGYSQMVLAEQAGISLGFLVDIEAGKKFPSAKTLQRIIDALGLAPYELFVGNEDWNIPRHHELLTNMERELATRINGQITYVFDKHFLNKEQ
jgi:transcriptional regulator with XRE-family HTH domain